MKLSLREHIFNIEKEQKKRRQVDPFYQKYHIMPPVGGIYEPSGLCDCDGDYYIFIQYSPMDVNRRGQCFGLYKSRDLLHFIYVGVPIISDRNIDKDGVFSGSTLLVGKEMYFYYTGKVKHLVSNVEEGTSDETGTSVKTSANGDIDSECEFNTIVVKISKDSYFNDVYSDKLVILNSKNYNDMVSGRVSGPKVWEDNGEYFMVHASKSKSQQGIILFFCSRDKINWEFKRKIEVKEEFNTFECPDLFYLERVPIISISMLNEDVKNDDKEDNYKSGYYFMDGETIEDYELGEFHEWDKGFDFYAPQTFIDRNGRVILIALMGIPSAEYINPTKELGWQHCLTISRELKLSEGKIRQSPINEIEMLRKNKQIKEITDELEITLKDTSEIILSIPNESKECNIFINNCLELIYDGNKQVFIMEFINELGYGRTKRKLNIKQLLDMRILLDSSSIEIFLNGGEEVLTSRIFKKEQEYQFEIRCINASLVMWEIEV